LSHTKKKWVRASDIAKGINQPPNTVKRVLEDLMILKVVESKEDQGKGEKGRNKPLLWRIKREIYQLIEITGFFDKQFVNK
jgi:predicted ArsR family transcriptional regulator